MDAVKHVEVIPRSNTVPAENNFPMGIFWNILEYFVPAENNFPMGIFWNILEYFRIF